MTMTSQKINRENEIDRILSLWEDMDNHLPRGCWRKEICITERRDYGDGRAGREVVAQQCQLIMRDNNAPPI
jgi:hypothetical protein